jgi:hypothetical protein
MQIVLVMRMQMTMRDPARVTMQMQVAMMRVSVLHFAPEIAQRENRNPSTKKYERAARDVSNRRTQALRRKYSRKPNCEA